MRLLYFKENNSNVKMSSISNDPLLTGVFLSLSTCLHRVEHWNKLYGFYARTPGGLDLII